MKVNMGTADRVIRMIIAVAIGVTYYLGWISGTVAIVLGVVAIIFLLTSLIGFCPLYAPFHWSTRTKKRAG